MAIARPGDPRFKELGFPIPGAILRYRGYTEFWFADIIDNAKKFLELGCTYTLKDIEVYSSWTKVTLVEFPEAEFCLSWFRWDHGNAETLRS